MPKYALLVEQLRGIVDASPVGTPVPSERALAEQSGVSRMTARRALAALEREGHLTRVVGRGSFVARPAVSLPLRLTSFSEDMRARGLEPSSRVLEQALVPAGEHAPIFGLDADAQIVRLVRLRLADGVPFAIERSHLRASAVPGLVERDLERDSLYALLEREHGIRFDAGEQSIRAGIVAAADAPVLELDEGAPVLELDRTSIMRGEVIEHTISTYPGSRFELSASIAPMTASERPRSALRSRD